MPGPCSFSVHIGTVLDTHDVIKMVHHALSIEKNSIMMEILKSFGPCMSSSKPHQCVVIICIHKEKKMVVICIPKEVQVKSGKNGMDSRTEMS